MPASPYCVPFAPAIPYATTYLDGEKVAVDASVLATLKSMLDYMAPPARRAGVSDAQFATECTQYQATLLARTVQAAQLIFDSGMHECFYLTVFEKAARDRFDTILERLCTAEIQFVRQRMFRGLFSQTWVATATQSATQRVTPPGCSALVVQSGTHRVTPPVCPALDAELKRVRDNLACSTAAVVRLCGDSARFWRAMDERGISKLQWDEMSTSIREANRCRSDATRKLAIGKIKYVNAQLQVVLRHSRVQGHDTLPYVL